MDENGISRELVTCAIEVHWTLGGPGLLESAYEEALVCELEMKSLAVKLPNLRAHSLQRQNAWHTSTCRCPGQ